MTAQAIQLATLVLSHSLPTSVLEGPRRAILIGCIYGSTKLRTHQLPVIVGYPPKLALPRIGILLLLVTMPIYLRSPEYKQYISSLKLESA